MTAQFGVNPFVNTNATGSFNIETSGYIQGTALDQPAVRFALSGGYLAPTETLPMWGGVGIAEAVPNPTFALGGSNTPRGALGGAITRASNLTANAAGQLTGFSVFDQAHAMVNSPQSPVPLAASYGSVNFYRLGSLARIAVAIDPALASLAGASIITLNGVSWDFTLQRLVPGVASYPANVFTGITRALVGGVYIATATTTTAHGIVVGDDFTVSGIVPAAYNGTWTAIAGTTGSTLVWNTGLTVDPGAETTPGTLVAGGGLLPVKVIDLDIGNSMTVSFDPTTGFATWNRTGSTAVIVI